MFVEWDYGEMCMRHTTWHKRHILISNPLQWPYATVAEFCQRVSSNSGMYVVLCFFFTKLEWKFLQVCRQDDRVIAELEHPVRGSEAWQWVEKNVTINQTTGNVIKIKLALRSHQVSTGKRQLGNNGSAFFDDIFVKTCKTLFWTLQLAKLD